MTEAGPAPVWKLAAAGSLAGALSGGLCNPAELAMVRMQADRGKPVERESSMRLCRVGLLQVVQDTEGLKRGQHGWKHMGRIRHQRGLHESGWMLS